MWQPESLYLLLVAGAPIECMLQLALPNMEDDNWAQRFIYLLNDTAGNVHHMRGALLRLLCLKRRWSLLHALFTAGHVSMHELLPVLATQTTQDKNVSLLSTPLFGDLFKYFVANVSQARDVIRVFHLLKNLAGHTSLHEACRATCRSHIALEIPTTMEAIMTQALHVTVAARPLAAAYLADLPKEHDTLMHAARLCGPATARSLGGQFCPSFILVTLQRLETRVQDIVQIIQTTNALNALVSLGEEVLRAHAHAPGKMFKCVVRVALESEADGLECCCCMEPIIADTQVVGWGCNARHLVHKKCGDAWRGNCPHCRYDGECLDAEWQEAREHA